MSKILSETDLGQRIQLAHTERVEHDCIPRAVTLEMLCRPGVRMTNKERKLYIQSLEIHHVSTRRPRADRGQEILANRLKSRTWLHLLKRDKRCKAMRLLLQQAFVVANRRKEKIGSKTGKPNEQEVLMLLMLDKQLALLEVQAKRIEMAWDCVTEEIERRTKICNQKKSTCSQQ